MKKWPLAAAVVAAAAFSGLALAGGSPIDTSYTGAVAQASPQPEVGATFGNLDLSVQVDETYCATGGVQCTGTGHTAAAAGPTNHNPVRIGFQLLSSGVPVTNVGTADVTVVAKFVPAGGSGLARLVCASCFQNAGNGVYDVFVHPALTGNWRSGAYLIQVTVTNPSSKAKTYALGRIDIPFS